MASTYHNFMGAKLALFVGDRLAVLKRDDRAGLIWPGFWDLPGGGRENEETPVETVLRETMEELSLAVPASQVRWGRAYTNSIGRTVWFLAGYMPPEAAMSIVLGSEGQAWKLMPVQEFLEHPKAVPQFQLRIRDYRSGVQSQLFSERPPALTSGGR